MGVPVVDRQPMNVEAFLRFTDARPDDERWELIDGEPILNATPSFRHQRIAGNIFGNLLVAETSLRSDWAVVPGLGVRVSSTRLPIPDVLVRPQSPPHGNPASRDCDDMIVAFEVLSPSTADHDLRWNRIAYSGMPTLTHYVVAAQDEIDVVVFARQAGFAELRLRSLDDVIALPNLGVSVPLSIVYRGTELASG